jgi:hypothetical protein
MQLPGGRLTSLLMPEVDLFTCFTTVFFNVIAGRSATSCRYDGSDAHLSTDFDGSLPIHHHFKLPISHRLNLKCEDPFR